MNKKLLTMLFALILLVVFSLTAGSQEFAGCCCDLSEGTSYNDDDGQIDATVCFGYEGFNVVMPSPMDVYENRGCRAICAASAGPGEGIPPGAECEQIDYTPAPIYLTAENIKGENQVRISWDSECPADYFIITRCGGAEGACEEIAGQETRKYFVDEENLLFDQDYTYEVIAHYNIADANSDLAQTSVNTGDIECWKIYHSSKFCISKVYYEHEQFQDYFNAHGYGFLYPGDFSDYETAVKDLFFDKFNKAFSCGADNKLSSPDDVCAAKGITGGICIGDGDDVDCVAPSECESLSTEGFFGLFSSEELCEGDAGAKKFCYLDKSKSIIDKCYSCTQDMSCYDYRSQRACQKDNCGMGECAWKDIYPEIGIGVCADERFSSCYLCDKMPSGGSSESFNEIFEQCSEEKSEALSTEEYPCYWKNWQSFGCAGLSCMQYLRASECATPPGGMIELFRNNSLKKTSSDPCEIKVCQWRADPLDPQQGDCLKNADGDTGLWPDCAEAEDREACELDYIPPETTIVATGALGIYDQLHINIFDKISRTDPGEYKTGSKVSGYITHFCHYPEAGSECDIHAQPINTSAGVLTLNYLTLHNTEIIDVQTKLTDLAEGWNYIKYYSKDPSNNPGIVQSVRVYACENCMGPRIINYYFENGVEIGGAYYTNSPFPVFRADFNVEAEITTAEINTADSSFVTHLTPREITPMNYSFASNIGLDEGDYLIRINSKDDEGTYMTVEFTLPFTVDLTKGIVNFTVDGNPAEGTIITKQMANIGVKFTEEISSLIILMNRQDVSDEFSTSDNKFFTATNLALTEGVITLNAEAKDLAANTITGSASFEVNAKAPVIKLREPTYGVSGEWTFPLVVQTLNTVNCRFLYDVHEPENFSFIDLEPFDSTGSNFHRINNFIRINFGDYEKHALRVFCIDPLHGMGKASFNISVDDIKPTIKSSKPNPKIIKEALAEDTYGTFFKVETDELTFCKYSKEYTNYSFMEGVFPGYKAYPPLTWPNDIEIPKTAHTTQVTVSEQNKSYSYYVACEDLGGNINAPPAAQIDFSVDLSINFSVTDRTGSKYKNDTTVVLAVETNKRAFCFYGTTDLSIVHSFQNDGEYSHTTKLTNLPFGENTFYAQCFTKYETPKETSEPLPIKFIVDTTPPYMVYVNDTGPNPADPGFSYFKDALRVKWLGKDNESPVTTYYYLIQTFYAKTPIINWTETVWREKGLTATGLNLTQDTTYKFLFKPKNAAGLIGDVMESDGVTVDFTKMPDICNDSYFGGFPNETDVDCGGICPACANDLICLTQLDCQSGFCDNSTTPAVCKGPAFSCDDNISNGDETDVDCGGSCSPCEIDSICLFDSDCETGLCLNGMCAEPDACYNLELDGTETDVDCGGSCPITCAVGKSCLIPADCTTGLCVNGLCEAKKEAGAGCINDSECASGLVCKNGVCEIKKKEEDAPCVSDTECGDGLMCYEGSCVKDTDGDGMPDIWETMYGLNPNSASDAFADFDNDDISNMQEFSGGTNPSNSDTDGDRWSDGQEARFGTDPLDYNSKPPAWLGLIYNPVLYWWLWLVIIIAFLIFGFVAFFGYRAYMEFKKEKAEKGAAAIKRGKIIRPVKVKRGLTPEEKMLLLDEAKKDKAIALKLNKLKGLIEKKPGVMKKGITDKEWMDIDNLVAPIIKEKPEIASVFKKLTRLKKGKLGVKGRKKALEELEELLGKKPRKGAVKKGKATAFERLEALGKRAKGARLKIKKDPLEKLKLMALTKLTPQERKKVLEKLILLRTGKLTAADRKALFEKIRITAEYYEKHKKTLEREFEQYVKRKKLKKKQTGK